MTDNRATASREFPVAAPDMRKAALLPVLGFIAAIAGVAVAAREQAAVLWLLPLLALIAAVIAHGLWRRRVALGSDGVQPAATDVADPEPRRPAAEPYRPQSLTALVRSTTRTRPVSPPPLRKQRGGGQGAKASRSKYRKKINKPVSEGAVARTFQDSSSSELRPRLRIRVMRFPPNPKTKP